MIESQLRQLFKETIAPDLIKLEEYDHTDAYSAKFNSNIEFKCLTKHHPRIMLEKAKYDEMIGLSNPRYVVSTPKGIWSFALDKLKNIEWIELQVHHSTYYHRETEYANKECTFLPLGWAKDLTQITRFKTL